MKLPVPAACQVPDIQVHKLGLQGHRVVQPLQKVEAELVAEAAAVGHVFIEIDDPLPVPGPGLLVEFNFEESPLYVFKVLQNIQKAGIVPVLAHPERYAFVQQEPYIVHDLIRAGIIIQINRGSILGKFGSQPKAAADYLLKHSMVHIVASDGHRSYSRAPILYDAYAEVEKHYGKEYADMLFKKNPQNILLDKDPAFLKVKLRHGKEF